MTPHRSRLYHRLEAGWWSSSGRVPQTVVMMDSMYINSMMYDKRITGSCGCIQSSFEPFLLRVRSIRARSARVGVLMAHGRRQIGHRDPHLRLSIPLPFAHRHGGSVVQNTDSRASFTKILER